MLIILPILALAAVDATGSVALSAQVAECHKRLIDAEEALAAERVVFPRRMKNSTALRALEAVKRDCANTLSMHVSSIANSIEEVSETIKSEQDHVTAIHSVLGETFEEFQRDVELADDMFKDFPCTQEIDNEVRAVLFGFYVTIWAEYDIEHFSMDLDPERVRCNIYDRRREVDDKLSASGVHPHHRVAAARLARGITQAHIDEYALMATDNHRRYDTLRNSRDELLAELAVAHQLERRMNC